MMKRFCVALVLLAMYAVAPAQEAVFTTRPNARPELVPLPKEEGVFHFVVYGDRTGGPEEGISVLRQAVSDTNLLDPDLVMTVGDLINGYNERPKWMEQMQEYRDSMAKLNMPWFPVPGNHDIYWRGPNMPEGEHESDYETHFGPLWYAFKHKNCGFIAFYSDEGDPATGEKSISPKGQNVSEEQLDFLRQALAKLKDCEHVFMFLHHPRWLGNKAYIGTNWDVVHKTLVDAGNVTAVFGGHIHKMTYTGKKDGIEYFTLAAVGAHLKTDLPEAGYLHHFNVVTVRKDGIQLATIPVGEVVDPREFTLERIADIEAAAGMPVVRKSEPVEFPLEDDVRGTYTVELTNPTMRPLDVSLGTDSIGAGWEFLPDHHHFVIEPGKTQVAAFRYRGVSRASDDDFTTAPLSLNVEYLAETARVPLPERLVPLEFAIPTIERAHDSDVNRALAVNGDGAVKVESEAITLSEGPFTLEAWVNPSSLENSQGLVAKTQGSEFAIFLHDGSPDFSVHLDGKYATAITEEKLQVDRWTHLAGVFTGEEVLLFIDGKVAGRVAATGTRTRNDLPLYIGADPGDEGQQTRPFHGMLDEVRLSRTARYRDTFEPQRRIKADAETVFMYDFDRAYGPWVLDGTKSRIPARVDGEARLVRVEEKTAESVGGE